MATRQAGCGRCGAVWAEEPSCGKTAHRSLPSAGAQGRLWLWSLEGEPHATVVAADEDEAGRLILAQRERDAAALNGRAEPNDEDREEARYWHEEQGADSWVRLADLPFLR